MNRIVFFSVLLSICLTETYLNSDSLDILVNSHYAIKRHIDKASTPKTKAQSATQILENYEKIGPTFRDKLEKRLVQHGLTIPQLQKQHQAGLLYTQFHTYLKTHKQTYLPHRHEQKLYKLSHAITKLEPQWKSTMTKELKKHQLSMPRLRRSYLQATHERMAIKHIEKKSTSKKISRPEARYPKKSSEHHVEIAVVRPTAIEKIKEKYRQPIHKKEPTSVHKTDRRSR